MYLEICVAFARLSQIIIFPKRKEKILALSFLLLFTNFSAVLMKPGKDWINCKCSCLISLPLIVSIGKNVALPALLFFKNWIHSVASSSSLTITYCVALPKAILIALSYFSSTTKKSLTKPRTPAREC
jgi:hypothetical protein